MSLVVRCPTCQTSYAAGEHLIGTQVRCPGCGGAVLVAAPGSSGPSKSPETASPPQEAEDEGELKLGEKKGETQEASMDMTPMVDVTFLLLIFFMVTAAFSLQKSLQVPTPRPDEASANVQPRNPSEDPDTVTVHVDENDLFRVVTTDWDVEAPSRQELLIRLREASQGNSQGRRPTKLLVMANVEASHGNVITAMDVGSDVGMEQVQLMIVEENE